MPVACTCRFACIPTRAMICPCASNGPDGTRVHDKRLRSCKALRHGLHGYAKFNSPMKSNITRARSRARDFFAKIALPPRAYVALAYAFVLPRFTMVSRTKQSAPRYRTARAAMTVLVIEVADKMPYTRANVWANFMNVILLNSNSQC